MYKHKILQISLSRKNDFAIKVENLKQTMKFMAWHKIRRNKYRQYLEKHNVSTVKDLICILENFCKKIFAFKTLSFIITIFYL